jgi:cellulose synthase operon protein C
VHGFKPYNAATIFARRFGDCKDKATLMTVMLAEVGIRAWPVLIYGDPRRSAEDLTLPLVNHFNHCITYIPASGARPELYLDGTATFHSLEELPTMDRGARVLVVRDDGGAIQEIPWNPPEGFSHEEEIQIILGEDRGAEIQVRGASRGDFAVSVRRSFEIAAQRKTDLEKAYGGRYAGVSVKDASFSDLANLDEPVGFSFVLAAPRVLEEAPEGLVLKPPEDLFSTGGMLGNIASLEERTTDVILGSPRRAALRVRIALPPGYRVRSLPAAREATIRAGRLKATFESGPDGILMERVLEITSPRVPLADYAEFREFAATVNQLREERILLERS